MSGAGSEGGAKGCASGSSGCGGSSAAGGEELGGAGLEAEAAATDVVVGGVRDRAPLLEAQDQEETTDPGGGAPRFRYSACRVKGIIPSCRHPARFRSL